MDRPLTLLHTADVHLGASFPYLGSEGKDHRRLVAEAFQRVVDEALSRRVDLFVVAGDLFHTRTPGRPVVELALSALARLAEAGVTVALAPGTHDHDGPDSVWRLAPFEERVSGVQLLTGEGLVERRLPALGVTLLARPNATNASPESPLRGLSADGRQGVVVGVAHGSVTLGDKIGQSDFPIAPEDIASSGLQYLALGHWHKPADYSREGVAAWYSGSPEVLYPKDSGAGKALLVTIGGGDTKVEALQVGCLRAESVSWSVEECAEPTALEAALLKRADPKLMLDATLSGLKPLGSPWTPEVLGEVEARLAGDFYFLRISDETHPRLDDEAVMQFSEATVAGRFVRTLSERLGDARSEDERRTIEEAIQVGLGLLEGREEVLG